MRQFPLLPALMVFLFCSTRSSAAEPPYEILSKLPVGKLAFVSAFFGSQPNINVIEEQIEPFQGQNPEFTPDGTKLIYSNNERFNEGSRSVLFVRDLSTASSKKIDTRAYNSEYPSLSPDGLKLAFVVWSKKRDSSQIFVSDADGSNWLPLTTGSFYNWSPRWSPDGSKILFETKRDGERQVYVMHSNGQNQINLSNNKFLSHAPSWSPNGSHIAYMSCAENNQANIFVMKSDGTEKTNISHGMTRDSEPVWSPDGEWIAFTRRANNPSEPENMGIWIMRKDGTEQRQITRNITSMGSNQLSWSR
jgi:tol-pal system beta propeller repeat protein TolB